MASSRSEENVSLKHFQHMEMSQCWCAMQFCFGHFCLECLADVIANVCLAIICYLAITQVTQKSMAITSAHHVNPIRNDIKQVVTTSIPLNNTGFKVKKS